MLFSVKSNFININFYDFKLIKYEFILFTIRLSVKLRANFIKFSNKDNS